MIGAGPGHQVVLYAKSGVWWVQPLTVDPFTTIEANSTWENRIHLGTEYAALLVECADRRRVVRDVVRDGLTVTLAGLAVGVVAALATVRVVKTLLFGVTPQDPLTLAAAGASLIAIAILACSVPASRAARVDPIIALRGE